MPEQPSSSGPGQGDASGPPESDPSAPLAELLHPKVDRRLRRLPGLIRDALRLVWRAGRRELVVTAVLQALGGVALAVQLLAGKRLVADLLRAHSHAGYEAAVPSVIIVAVAVAVASATNVARFELQQLLGELVSRYTLTLVIRTAARADLLSVESSEYHDALQRALYNGSSRPLQLTTGMLSLISALAGVIGVGVTLIVIQPLFFLLSVVAIIPVGVATILAGRALYGFGHGQTEGDRRRTYLQLLLTQREAAKELRAYDLAEHLQGRYSELYDERISGLRRVLRRRAGQGVAGSLLTSVISGAAIALLIVLLDEHHLSLAGAAAAAAGLLLLGNQLQGLVSGVGALYESSLFVQDFLVFVRDTPETPADPTPPAPVRDWDTVAAHHVSFSYPGQTRPALNDVSLSVRRNEVVALVGENGSGKSTLAKVMAGLYDPPAGTVTWDGVDLAGLDARDRSERVAVLFQDFVHYQMDVRANVTMGAWRRRHDEEALRTAAIEAGATDLVDSLPAGWDTQLGPQFFGGVDLSGGQWQRIALARALFRDTPLVILDEPTAALDPRSEHALFQAVRRLFHGRSVLLITHRFTSARLADRICVLDDGRVVEEGNHAELLDRDGLYAELYRLQSTTFDPPA